MQEVTTAAVGWLIVFSLAFGCADATEQNDSQAPQLTPAICGDGLCHPSENVTSCSLDCAYCGDRVCSPSESPSDCPEDCRDQGPADTGMPHPDSEPPNDDDLSEDSGAPMMPVDPNQPRPDPNASVLGFVDAVALHDGQWVVRGWACHEGWAPSLEVEVFAGGDANEGDFVKRALADQAEEDAVGSACGVEGGSHRYVIPFSDDELDRFAGQRIFVYAVSPVGNENRGLNNSGQFSLPELGQALPEDLQDVTWLHTDVSGWPVTTDLSVSFSGGSICLEYDKKNVWPPVSIRHTSGTRDIDVVANPWVFVERQGRWYAGTWEWLIVGATCRNMNAVAGDHIKQFHAIPRDWRPRSGERLYFMVSALARFGHIRNVQERSQIVEVVWP